MNEKLHIEMIGMPLDLGAGRRGVDMGPSAMRLAGISERLRKMHCDIRDAGDIALEIPEVLDVLDPKLRFLPQILTALEKLAATVREIVERGHFPLVLGGDHSIAMGTVSGVAAAMRQKEESLGVIWVDAHGDMNTHETTPSGNIHGMPFAALLGRGASALTDVAFPGAKIRPEDAVLVGARALDSKEQRLIRESGITVFTMEEIDRRGIFEVMTDAVKIATAETDRLHLSLDIDALDPQAAPGVGTPVRGGLTYREAHSAMETIARCEKLGSMEIVEVNPILDDRNKTAETAVELVLSAFGKRILA